MRQTTLPRGSLGRTSSRQNGHIADCSLPRCTTLRRENSVLRFLACLACFDAPPTAIEEEAAGAAAADALAGVRRRPWPVVWRAARADAALRASRASRVPPRPPPAACAGWRDDPLDRAVPPAACRPVERRAGA